MNKQINNKGIVIHCQFCGRQMQVFPYKAKPIKFDRITGNPIYASGWGLIVGVFDCPSFLCRWRNSSEYNPIYYLDNLGNLYSSRIHISECDESWFDLIKEKY